MELEALKEIWREAGDKTSSQPANAEIIGMLNKSSQSPIAKMKRNVLKETVLVIVLLGGIAIYYFIAFKSQFNIIAWFYTGLAVLFGLYYYRKWKLLDGMQCVACQVKSNLQRQVQALESYIRFYLLAGTVVVPLIFVFLGLIFYYKFPAGAFYIIFPPIYKSTRAVIGASIIWVISLSLVSLVTFCGNRYFINRLYGRHIRQLKQILDQMEDE